MFVYALDTLNITDLPCNRVLLTVHTGHPHHATRPVHLVLINDAIKMINDLFCLHLLLRRPRVRALVQAGQVTNHLMPL